MLIQFVVTAYNKEPPTVYIAGGDVSLQMLCRKDPMD